ncbi:MULTISPECIES: hypothetical protein [unclassified Aureimonas]|uniref:hypothetical protein n=1 Tax=unclassified Aureimonas TaxID=2615206 RepID=UPI0007022838|nr:MULTISPECIES: hypothetical protein [unclassified Aureimonas]KQT52247.1 hypothetical protein ASG62_16455 [Aureimonas sp. Leaf427]KQT65749.1 hypothetical protein ASG54_22605 [Aureimonas sp. Leaf460]
MRSAAVPAMAFVGALPSGEALALAVPPATTAAAMPAVRASTPWKWWIGDGERFHESFGTREEAITAARDHEAAFITEARQGMALLEGFDGGGLCDLFEEWNEENGDPDSGEPVFDSVTGDDWNDLAERLNAVTLQWALDRDIDRKAQVWMFAATRNMEGMKP